MKTIDDFKRQVKDYGIKEWHIYICLGCNSTWGYIFGGNGTTIKCGQPYCCAPDFRVLEDKTWEDVAEHYNRQTDPKIIEEYNNFWHFEEIKK